MADPSFLINHAVNYFLSQWYSGLQPSLNINTCHNGEIFISSKVKSIGQELYSNRRRRSGRHARERRRKERSQTIASNKSIVEETVQLETVKEKKGLNSVLLACDEEINLDLSIKSDAVPDATSKEVNLIDAAVQAVPIFIYLLIYFTHKSEVNGVIVHYLEGFHPGGGGKYSMTEQFFKPKRLPQIVFRLTGVNLTLL